MVNVLYDRQQKLKYTHGNIQGLQLISKKASPFLASPEAIKPGTNYKEKQDTF